MGATTSGSRASYGPYIYGLVHWCVFGSPNQSNISGLGEYLGANGSDQGAQEDVVLADMGKIAPKESQVWQDSRQDWYHVLGEIKTRDVVEWLVEEDLRGQRVLAALAHDMGTKAAKETFRRVFFRRETPHPVRDQEPMLGMVGIAEGIIPIVVGKDALVALSRTTRHLFLNSN